MNKRKSKEWEMDRDFYLRAVRRLEAELPLPSNLLDRSAKLDRKHRALFRKEWKQHYKVRMKDHMAAFFNSLFAEVDEFVAPLIRKAEISDSLKDRARSIYSFRLPHEATLLDLLKADSFFGQTTVFDFQVFKGAVEGVVDRNMARASSVHWLLHRGQQSEFVFLNETFVGHFLNQIREGVSEEPRSALWPESSNCALATYSVGLLAKILHLPQDVLCGLHFADTRTIERIIPSEILGVFQAAFQVFSYMFLYSRLLDDQPISSKGFPTRSALGMAFSCFLIPCLDECAAGRGGYSKESAALVDARLFPLVAPLLGASHKERKNLPGPLDWARALIGLAAEISELETRKRFRSGLRRVA